MRIYIVRHGDTNLNKKRVLQGRYDEKLNEKGILLAKISGQNLKGIHFDEAFSSPLSRSIETVKCILEESNNYDVPIHIDNRLIEIDLGDWTLKELDNKDLEDYETINSFFHNPFSVTKCKNGESIYDVISRTQEFIKELIDRNDDKTYLVGTHGIAMRSMLNMFYKNKDNFWQTHVPYNCSFNIIEVKNGVAKLIEEDKCFYSATEDYYK